MTPTDHQAQLEWEARVGRLAAAAAIVSAVLALAGSVVYQVVALESRPDNDREFLAAVHDQPAGFFATAALQALSIALFAVALWYLCRVVTYRRPETPGWAIYLLYLAPVLIAAAGVILQMERGDAADQFLAGGPRTEDRAEDLVRDVSPVVAAFGSAGTLSFAIGAVLVVVNSVRTGILSRFMAIIGGVTAGALVLAPQLSGILSIFWLNALGILFLGRWPGGRGPAWETGEAVPWPSMAETRERTVGDSVRKQFEPEPEPEPGPDAPDGPDASDHPVSRKRTRKRRR